MRMTLNDVFIVCNARGVRITVSGSEMRARGRRSAVNDALKQGLAKHKQEIIELIGDGEFPDETLPDEIFVPAQLPNSAEAIRACIDVQRREPQAA